MGIPSIKGPARRVGSVRIIGGEWRGRRLPVPDITGVRPSPDRVRETVFNWLQTVVPGSRCLDLFAGTGVLGFEAVSRGARAVTLVERDPRVVQTLQESSARLGADARITVVCADALRWLETAPGLYDLVFLDPPFRSALLGQCIARLASGHLADDARIYIEAEAKATVSVPTDWTSLKSRLAGQVGYYL